MGGCGLSEVRELRLTSAQLAEMEAHVQVCLPAEACGLLAGANGTIYKVIPIKNQADSLVRFRMEPAEQLRAFNYIVAQGWQLLGIFHSHPAGPPRPSATDIAEAAYDVVHIIWSPSGGAWKASAFWIRSGLLSEVKLYVADGDAGLARGV